MKIETLQPYSFQQLGTRDNQEDSRFPDADAPTGYAPFFIVCDGVGGCEKGEVASSTVCSAMADALSGTDWNCPFTVEDFRRTLDNAYSALARKATDKNRGMATTMAFVCLHAGGCFMAHIGDSRIYHVRPHGGILYRSEDHSLVNVLVHSGNLTPEEAVDHPRSNVITRYIGVASEDTTPPKASTLNTTDIMPGDYFLLCSDGVTESIGDSTLVDILSTDEADAEKIAEMARLCKKSHDNNTAILVHVGDVSDSIAEEEGDMSQTETEKLATRKDQVYEVEAQQRQSFIAKIQSFVKNIFKG